MTNVAAQDMRLDQFQLVDRVTAVSPERRMLRAVARVPRSHSIFMGHFPGHPLMPGVLIAELMAQTSGFLLLARNGFRRMPFLAALKELNLRSFVSPGDVLVCEATLVHEGSGYAVLDANVRRDGETKAVADARLTFRVTAFVNSILEEHMRLRATEVGLPLHEYAAAPQAGGAP